MTNDLELPQSVADAEPISTSASFFEDFGHSAGELEQDGIDGMTAVHAVPVKVQAVLGRARMSVGELLRLRTGMVVELDRRVGEPVDIYVNDRLIARGEVVMIDNSLGVTLTEIVRPDR